MLRSQKFTFTITRHPCGPERAQRMNGTELSIKSLRFIPNIDSEEAAEHIYTSTILDGQEEVYLWRYLKYLRIILDILPVWTRDFISENFLSKRMVTHTRKTKSG
jgi:hypothetical protein